LNLVGDVKDPELLCQTIEPSMKIGGRHDVAPFPLDRFNKDGCYLIWRNASFEKVFANPIDASTTAHWIGALMIRAAVAISVRDVGDPGHERGESLFVNHLTCG
jgi:hypothetical protein